MKLTEELKQEICDLIEESLNSARLQGLQVEDEGGGFPLVDYLSYEGGHILKGKEEIANIVSKNILVNVIDARQKAENEKIAIKPQRFNFKEGDNFNDIF